MENFGILTGMLFVVGTIFSVSSIPLELKMDPDKIEPYIFEDMINSTVEGLRPDIPDPFVIEDTINLPLDSLNLTDILNGTLGISNISIQGLKGLLIPYLSMQAAGLILTFEFVIPVIEVDADYIADINLLNLLNVYGNGTARIKLDNLQIKGNTVVNLSPFGLKKLDLQIHLERVDVNIEGLLYDEGFSAFASGFITLLANDLLVTYLNDNAKEIGAAVSPTIEDIINNLLSGDSTTTVSPTTPSPTTPKPTTPSPTTPSPTTPSPTTPSPTTPTPTTPTPTIPSPTIT